MNKDDKRRCEILGIPYPPTYMGGVAQFNNATAQQLNLLLAEGFADANDAQHNSPEYQEFISFLQTYPRFMAHGYIVAPEREDYRVSIEGIQGPLDLSSEELKAFVMFCRNAEEFNLELPWAWWD